MLSRSQAGRGERAKSARKRRIGLGVLERLEARELMAFSPVIGPGPDLTVVGIAGPVAAYGGPLAVTVDVANLVHPNEVVNPLAALPNQPSVLPASPETIVAVYASPSRRFNASQEFLVGDIAIPALAPGTVTEQTATFTLPAKRPNGLPGPGHRIYLTFQVDPLGQTGDVNPSNNLTTVGIPVLISPPLPDLRALALQTPSTLQAGDVISPSIKIGNFGTVDSVLQAPIEVDLIVSPKPFPTKGSKVLARYLIESLTPLSQAPSTNFIVGDANLTNPPNVTTLFGAQVTLPKSSNGEYLGVIVDPSKRIRQIRDAVKGPIRPFSFVRKIGPAIAGLPPATVVSQPAPQANLFPIPPFGLINQTAPGSASTPVITPANPTFGGLG
ncbi:MAG: hypothetical protein NVSMB14_06700 [Isosphaeraceae bacterium]